jgi:hypothetical protein
MRIQILDEPVRQNVEFFLKVIRRAREKQVAKSLPADKVFRAWVNSKTGQLFFAGSGDEMPFTGKKEWRAVVFSCNYDQREGEISFFLQDADGRKGAFDFHNFDPSAMRILRDTMSIFSQIGQKLKGPSDLDTKIAVLSKMHIEAKISHQERNILIDTWHEMDRMQAETLLRGKPPGTYLFRQDGFAKILEERLIQEFGHRIKCFTLTFSAEGNKISDYTLVHSDGLWQIYNDDPSLVKQEKFSGLEEIILRHKNTLKYPLYRHEA